MQKSKFKIIVIIILLITGLVVCFYLNYKETEKNVSRAENKLVLHGFDRFYQKQNNKFCVKKEIDEQEQQTIIKDMLWIMENSGYRQIKEVKCEKGKGIEIK